MTLPVDFKRKKSLIKNLTFGIQFGIILIESERVTIKGDGTVVSTG